MYNRSFFRTLFHPGRGWAVRLMVSLALTTSFSFAQTPPANTSAPPSQSFVQGWPRTILTNQLKVEIFQPQIDNWDNIDLQAHAALAATFGNDKEPTYGVLYIDASTLVDRDSRTLQLDKIKKLEVHFPSAPQQEAPFLKKMRNVLVNDVGRISLDNLEAALAINQAEHKGLSAPLNNAPPAIIVSETPALLVYIDGAPAWRPVNGTKLERILNTRVLLLRSTDGGQQRFYLHFLDGYLTASNLNGPWQVGRAPEGAITAEALVKKSKQTDLLVGQPDKEGGKPPSLSTLPDGKVPQVFVAATPTELLVFDGAPDYVPLDGTDLLYAKNTSANVFKNMKDQLSYVLLAGRWFSASDLSGPWIYVPPRALPGDFAKIPDSSEKENVKAAVPGTQQAREAVISNEIPQTATIDRKTTSFKPAVDGGVELRPIEDTSLQYVLNAAAPIIRVDATHWYALHNAVWFTAASVKGPWQVAVSVPAVIYAIPATSPLHYVTYVKIYEATPTTVIIGYTPGYYGSIVTSDGIVVYGTGYAYTPWVGTYWYGPPVTYSVGVNICWTPWGGWAYGFGFGWGWGYASYGWWYPPAPWWGPYWSSGAYYNSYGGVTAWGPGGWAGTTGNIYRQWGNVHSVGRGLEGYNAFTGNQFAGRYGTAYNSVTGAMAVGRRGAVENVFTGNYAAGGRAAGYNPTTGIAASGNRATIGNVNSGNQATISHANVYNRNTGNDVNAARITGDQGNSVTRINNNVFGSKDGQVYHYNPDTHQWQQMVGNTSRGVDGGQNARTQNLSGENRQQNPGSPSPANEGRQMQQSNEDRQFSQGRAESLDRDFQSRQLGMQREDAFQNHGAQFSRDGFGGGGFRGGGFGGGGARFRR